MHLRVVYSADGSGSRYELEDLGEGLGDAGMARISSIMRPLPAISGERTPDAGRSVVERGAL
jgi:hypothetical protein